MTGIGTGEPVQTALFLVGVDRPENWPALKGMAEHVEGLRCLVTSHPDVVHASPARDAQRGGCGLEMQNWLERWARDEACRYALLIWTGHATRTDEVVLVTNDSENPAPWFTHCVPASSVGKILARARFERIAILVDTCYSGGAALDIASEIIAARQASSTAGAALTVIASSLPYQPSRKGEFLDALVSLLRDGPAAPDGRDGRWTERDRHIDPYLLCLELRDRFEHVAGRQRPTSVALSPAGPCVPNPRYRPHHALRDHFLLSASGVEPGSPDWCFTGREPELKAIVEWLANDEPGVLAIVGEAGGGKSAVLGWMAVLSDVGTRRELDEREVLGRAVPGTVPEVRATVVPVNAAGLSTRECAQLVASGLGIGGAASPDELVDRVRAAGRAALVIVDQLDEALDPTALARALLVPLAREPGMRVLAGTRPAGDVMRWLSPSATVDLRAIDPVRAADEAEAYVRRRLPDTPVEAATALARSAAGSFALLQAVTMGMRHGASTPAGILAGVGTIMERELVRQGELRRLVFEMLAALALAGGTGAPRVLWPEIAGAISGQHYQDADVDLVLRVAGDWVAPASEAGETVYRLHPPLVATWFAEEVQRGR